MNVNEPFIGWPSAATVRQATLIAPTGSGVTFWVIFLSSWRAAPSLYEVPSGPVTITVVPVCLDQTG